MYTDEDLEKAVEKGILDEDSVDNFRHFISQRKLTGVLDEENLRLIGSFNDVFVVIACLLLLFSSAWVVNTVHPAFAMSVVASLSWGLAEFFVRKRKMALPAIVLLISFVTAVFATCVLLFDKPTETAYMLAAAVTSVATWMHWRRFKVPLTVAAGTATAVIFVIALLLSLYPGLKEFVLYLVFFSGVVTFIIAMLWDSADLNRKTKKSDVAFWLHLVSAPLIVHPIFATLGVFQGSEGVLSVLVIVLLYVVLTAISLTIDRRAFMVSSLIYVLYALTSLLQIYGMAGDSFAFIGVVIGSSLLLLSGFWHKSRSVLIGYLPAYIQRRVPIAMPS